MADYTHIAKPGEPTHGAAQDSGGTGAGGDTRIGQTGMFRKGRTPDQRSTVPDAAATNHDHPAVPGTRTSIPGEGIAAEAGEPAGTAAALPDSDGTPAAQQGLARGGINDVEDQAYTSNPRLNPPTDDAGPGPSEQTPELQDPNYTAASERAKA